MKRRLLAIALAALLAVLGMAAVLAYVHKANDRAINGVKAESVLIATGTIQAGTSLAQAQAGGLLANGTYPESSLPKSVIRSYNPKLGKLFLKATEPQGQVLVQSMLGSNPTSVTNGAALLIPSGEFGVTVQVCIPADVAGYVTAGSEVAVFDTIGQKLNVQETCDVSHQSQSSGGIETMVVLAKVQVLSVVQAPANAPGTSSGGTSTVLDPPASSASSNGSVLVTLAVSQAEAERLITLDQTGLPYLALIGPNATATPFVPQTLFPQSLIP